MADHLNAFLIPIGDNRHFRVILDGVTGVHQAAIDLADHGSLGQASADAAGHLLNGNGMIESALTAVRQGDHGHSRLLSVVIPTKDHVNVGKNGILTTERPHGHPDSP